MALRILHLCNKVPFPSRDGSTIAMESLIRLEAATGAEVVVIALNTDKHPVLNPEVPAELRKRVRLLFKDVKIRPNALSGLLALNSKESYFASRFYHKEVSDLIRIELGKQAFDLVVIDGLFMAVYLPELAGLKVILRAHNVESQIWERQASVMSGGVKRSFVKAQTRRLSQWEEEVYERVNGIWAISEDDLLRIQKHNHHALYLPCTFEPEGKWKYSGSGNALAYHVGAMDWAPNISGMRWFLDEVWRPYLEKEGYEFNVLSRVYPPELDPLPNGINWIKERVPDSWFDDQGILVAPLLSGSGMRIKILEGMARGKAVLTTSIGAEGLGSTHAVNIHIEDEPAKFAAALKQLISDDQYRKNMGEEARKFAVSGFSDTSYLALLSQTLEQWRG